MLIKSYDLFQYRNISNIKKQNYQLPCTPYNFRVFHDYSTTASPPISHETLTLKKN